MKIHIGKPARGDKFYPRPIIREEILQSVSDNANIILSAPRRVGKTSILLEIFDNPPPNTMVVYIDTEAIETSDDFFDRMNEKIFNIEQLERNRNLPSKMLEKLSQYTNKIKSVSIAGVGEIEIEKTSKKSSYESFKEFLKETEFDNASILVLIDEFPVTVENIKQKEGSEAVKKFLQLNRALRIEPSFNEKIQFIYSGSIGLLNVVRKLGFTEYINDTVECFVPPLSLENAIDFLKSLLKEYDIELPDKLAKYSIEKIEWSMPFYIQALAREIRDIYTPELEPLKEITVDKAMLNVIDNINIYLDSYRSRLNKIFSRTEISFVRALLDAISENGQLTISEIKQLAKEYEVKESSWHIIHTLEYDGYINNQNNDNLYLFNSPIMRMWWQKHGSK